MFFENMLLAAGRRSLIEEVFSANAVWTAPLRVDSLVSLELVGGLGTDTVSWQSPAPQITLAHIRADTEVSVNIGTFASHANSAWSQFSALNGGSSDGSYISWQGLSIDSQGSGANQLDYNSRGGVYRENPSETGRKAGPYFGEDNGWGASGTWEPGDPAMVWRLLGYQVRAGGITTGGDTSGFSYTAEGGVGEPGESLAYQNVPVVPEQAYSLDVPDGGLIKISYLL